jgi:dsDNA-specific endonuclease/ATPase MutS2
MNARGMNGRKEIRKIESNHHCLTSMRRRISHSIATLAKPMYALVGRNPFKQSVQNSPLHTSQTRFRNFDQPTSSVTFFNRLVGIMVQWRACTLRHDAPAICKPLEISRFNFQP